MTKSELIRKIAALSGVSDSGAKLFFEMFLKELPEFLSVGESLKIKNLGYFSLKKGRIKSSGEEKEIDSDIIIFSESENFLKNNYLFFLVPVHREGEQVSNESFFSLSLNKVTVTPDDIIAKDLILPPDDNELESILSDKVLNILIENEKISGTGAASEININEEFKDELQSPEVSSIELEDKESPVEISEDLANIPFDLSNDINNLKDEYLSIQNELTDLSVNLQSGEEVEDWKIEKPDTEEMPPDLLEEDEFEKLMKESNLYNNIEDKPDENIAADFFNDKPNENYRASENKEYDLNENYLSEEERNKRRASDKISDSEIEPIETWDVDKVLGEIDKAEIQENPVIKEEIPAELEKEIEKSEKDFQEIISEEIKNIESVPPKIDVKDIDETDKKFSSKSRQPERLSERRKIKKNVWLQLILLIAIFAAAFYYYFNFVATGDKKIAGLTEINSDPVIIEREYNIPVTYPYNEERNKNLNKINPVEAGVFNPLYDTLQNILIEDSAQKTNEAEVSSKPVRIKRHIYKLNDEYLVQIASWYNKDKADAQASLLAARGYEAIVKQDIAAGDPVFVVVVNHFKTLQEAEEFYNKNQ